MKKGGGRERERERERESERERERERKASELLSATNRKYDVNCKIGVSPTTQAADWVPCVCHGNKTILIPCLEYKEIYKRHWSGDSVED